MKFKQLIFIFISTITSINLLAQELEGEYQGIISAPDGFFKRNPLIAAQVYCEGDKYKIGIYPDLWRRAPSYVKFESDITSKEIIFDKSFSLGYYGEAEIKGNITSGKITATLCYTINRNEKIIRKTTDVVLKKIERKSPTIGMNVPAGGVKLFDGKTFEGWKATNDEPIKWELTGDGAIKIKDKKDTWVDIVTTKTFKNFKLHIEFKIPDERKKELGQDRSNSGVFIGPFEVQILDSFGAEGTWNECGALYKFMPPQINASLPPKKWQTYDIEFKSAKFEDGKIKEYPHISVYHNGMKVQGDIKLNEHTANGSAFRCLDDFKDESVSIRLQNHQSPIMFRNIWILPIED